MLEQVLDSKWKAVHLDSSLVAVQDGFFFIPAGIWKANTHVQQQTEQVSSPLMRSSNNQNAMFRVTVPCHGQVAFMQAGNCVHL